MFKSLFLKTLYDKRWFLVGWAVGLIALLALTAAFYPVIADSVSDLLQAIPPALSSLVGEAGAYSTYEGYLGSAVFGIRAEMIFVPLAIILALSLSVNEESSRRLYQLLAQPVSRFSIVLQKWFGGVCIIVIIMALVYGSLIITSLMVGEVVPYAALTKMTLMSGIFTVALFSLTLSLAFAFGRRGIAIIVPIVWVMGSLLLDSFGAQIDWLKNADWLSLHQYYNTATLSNSVIDVTSVAVLGSVTIVPLFMALVAFQLRDIRETE